MKTVLKIILVLCIISVGIMLSSLDYYGYYYESEEIHLNEGNIVIALMTVLFLVQLFILVWKTLNSFEDFKTDYLLFRPSWIKNNSLGIRRLLSIITNASILVSISTCIILALGLLFDDFRERDIYTFMLTVFISTFIFWTILLIVGLIKWIRIGFKE